MIAGACIQLGVRCGRSNWSNLESFSMRPAPPELEERKLKQVLIWWHLLSSNSSVWCPSVSSVKNSRGKGTQNEIKINFPRISGMLKVTVVSLWESEWNQGLSTVYLYLWTVFCLDGEQSSQWSIHSPPVAIWVPCPTAFLGEKEDIYPPTGFVSLL